MIPGSPGQKSAAKSQKSASGSQKSHLRSQKSDFIAVEAKIRTKTNVVYIIR